MIKQLLYVGLLISICFSCEKENNNIDITSSNWKVVKIKKEGNIFYTKVSEDYTINFSNDSIYNFRMVCNTCGGSFKLESKGQIEIERGFCTMVGGEPDFSDELYEIILNSKEYFGLDDKLILQGNDEVLLEKY